VVRRHYLHDQVLIPVRVFLYAIPLFAVLGLLSDSYNYYGFGILDISHTWFWLNLASVLVTMVRAASCRWVACWHGCFG